jgi:hypothetical protein
LRKNQNGRCEAV